MCVFSLVSLQFVFQINWQHVWIAVVWPLGKADSPCLSHVFMLSSGAGYSLWIIYKSFSCTPGSQSYTEDLTIKAQWFPLLIGLTASIWAQAQVLKSVFPAAVGVIGSALWHDTWQTHKAGKQPHRSDSEKSTSDQSVLQILHQNQIQN